MRREIVPITSNPFGDMTMSEKLVPIEGSVPFNKHKMVGAANPKERLEVTVKLRRKTEEGLPTLDEFVAGKRAFMTRQQLGERYGARHDDAVAVQSWAVGQGLSVSHVDLGRRQMHLVGSLDAMSRAFGVKLQMYEHSRTHSKFRCPTDNIHVPAKLAPIITGVFGLNDMPVVVRSTVLAAPRRTASADPKSNWPGSFYPNEVAQLYNFPSTKGDGQRVAILEFGGGFDQTVLDDYFENSIGLQTPPTVNALMVLNAEMDIDDGATGEVYLDIEVVGAMAPSASIDVYFAPWTGAGYLNAIEQAIHNDDYAGVSISYGLDEDLRGNAANPGWPMLHSNVDEAFRDANAVGIPVFISSGDQGSGSSRGPDDVTLLSKAAHASFPATSPYVTAVGGTLLYAKNGAISQEVVWNELGALQNNPQIGKFYVGGATGGGVSDRYKQVPSYQSGAGINPQSANSPSATGRGVPDVAGNAGASTGYLVSQPPGSPDPIAPVGGTSAAAPMWAALMACVRQALESNFNGNVPRYFFNDFAYAKGSTAAFRDIVGGREFTNDPSTGEPIPGQFIPIGNNRSTQVDGYDAKQGFDLCTGWGSPNGQELLKQLQAWLATQPGN
jgi:kumamolisin